MVEALKEQAEQCKSKHELDRFIGRFSQRETLEALKKASKPSRADLANVIREKLLELIFSKGDVADRAYLYLYGLMEELEIEPEGRFDGYVTLADQYLCSPELGIVEKILLSELKATALILKGEPKEAIKEHLKALSTLHIHEAANVGVDVFVKDFCQFFSISMDELFEALSESLTLEHYLSLDFVARRSIFNWSLHIFWNIPSFYNNPRWMELYPLWRAIFEAHLGRGELDEAMYVHFYIYHKMGNHFQSQEEWKRFNEEIVKVAEPHYKACTAALPSCKEHTGGSGKRLIGFLRDRVVENSPYKVEWSLLKALMQNEEFREKYEVKLYLMGYVEKSDDDPRILQSYREIGIEVVDVVTPLIQGAGYYHSHLQKALAIRERIVRDGVDILISPNNGYDISDFIFISRAAPTQVYWSHGNYVYDVEGIDKRISHCGVDKYGFSFEKFAVPMDRERFYNPPIAKSKIEAERAKYPKDAFVLGVIGRLIKVDSDEYLETIAQVMRQSPQTIFIAAGSGNAESIRAKVENLGISDRFYMPGWVDPHLYGHIIDLWCDTFPLEQGESAREYTAKHEAPLMVRLIRLSRVERSAELEEWLEEYRGVAMEVCENRGAAVEGLYRFIESEQRIQPLDTKGYIEAIHWSINEGSSKNIRDNKAYWMRIYRQVVTRKLSQDLLSIFANL